MQRERVNCSVADNGSLTKVDIGGTLNLQSEFWDWTKNSGAGGWDVIQTDQLKTRYLTFDAELTASKYVRTSDRRVRARVTVQPGIVSGGNWWYYLEQAVWISQ